MSKITDLLVSAFMPVVKSVAKDKLVELLDQLQQKNEASYKTALTALYPVVDVQLEDVTEKTETTIDDSIVDALKEAIEESARKHGLQLANLDSD